MQKENSDKKSTPKKVLFTSHTYRNPKLLPLPSSSSLAKKTSVNRHSSSKIIKEKIESDKIKIAAETCHNWVWNKQQDSLIQGVLQNIAKRPKSLTKKKKSDAIRKALQKNSPYVKNSKDFQRIISLLKPVRGPTDSLLQQIKKHNDNNRKNMENVLLGNSEPFHVKMEKYWQRIGLSPGTKVFIFNSKDKHIKDALLKDGWVQNQDQNSPFFHLKYIYIDSPSQYENLQSTNVLMKACQLLNHFPNNQQLTNKNLLHLNIKSLAQPQKCVLSKNPFYQPKRIPSHPLTFDLERTSDFSAFVMQYSKFQWYQFMGKLWDYAFKDKELGGKMEKILSKGQSFQGWGVRQGKVDWFVDKMESDYFKISQNQQCKKLRQQLYSFLFGLIKFYRNYSKSPQKAQTTSETLQFPFHKLQKTLQTHKRTPSLQCPLTQCLKNDPILLLLFTSIKRKLDTLYSANYGNKNWWIIKPTGVSRGSGIRIQKDFQKIVAQKHGKIVQKYIERPLILGNLRKFDIRQWVLVTSFSPLVAYAYKTFYCRCTHSPYSTQNPNSLQTHLTNYSHQKPLFTNKQQSILSQQQLLKLIEQQGSTIGPHLKKTIYRHIVATLKSVQVHILSQPQYFQIYGFDIILSQSFQPSILQVNMSPACQQRSPFLSQALKDMAQGVLHFVNGGQGNIGGWDRIGGEEGEQGGEGGEGGEGEREDWIWWVCGVKGIEAAVSIQRFWRRVRSKRWKVQMRRERD